jgi:hypothetical protein
MSSIPTVPASLIHPSLPNPSSSSLPTQAPTRSPQDPSNAGSITGVKPGPRVLKKPRPPPSRTGTVPLSAVDSPRRGSVPLKRSISAGSAEPSGRVNYRPFVSFLVARFVGGSRARGSSTAGSRSGTPALPPKILFYHKHEPHYGFTNFSYHTVKYDGKEYPTSEHLFQSFKAC